MGYCLLLWDLEAPNRRRAAALVNPDDGRRRPAIPVPSGRHCRSPSVLVSLRLVSPRLGRTCRQPGRSPRLETAVQVGRLRQPDPPQRCRGQRRGVALRAHHDDLHVGPGQRRNPGLAARVEPPLQHVAADDDRAGYLALDDSLLKRPDVDEHRAVGQGGECRLRAAADARRCARLGEQFVDAGCAVRKRLRSQPRGRGR